MLNRILYRILMLRLRGEIARLVREEEQPEAARAEKYKTARVNACKACGSIV